jgi:integrase
MDLYLRPFFGEMTFAALSAATFEKFIVWAKSKRYADKEISAATVNKCFTLLHMICKSAAIEYGWGIAFNPFFGFKRLPADDPYEGISPLSLDEQRRLIEEMPDHWRPYFKFAFSAGLRPGEQMALKLEDIDWEKGLLHVRRALTLDENGKRAMGRTKNRYSRRTIKLIPAMLEALKEQKTIHESLGGEYFFCTTGGTQVNVNNLRNRVWAPALKKANLASREMKQTRHTFATIALSCGENPLWIAKVMGHRNTEMIIKVYGKYIEKAGGTADGHSMSRLLQNALKSRNK